MAPSSVNAGFRCSIMNCDNYSRNDRFPLDEERYVNKYKIIQKVII